jgi:hypothetical protein
VIGANNRLAGYGGGMDRKRWLLTHEGAWSDVSDNACSSRATHLPPERSITQTLVGHEARSYVSPDRNAASGGRLSHAASSACGARRP